MSSLARLNRWLHISVYCAALATTGCAAAGRAKAVRSVERGQTALASHDLDEAKTQFARAASSDPKSAAAQAGLGRVYAARRALDKAADHFRQAMKLDPQTASHCIGLGDVLLQQAQTSMERGKVLALAIRAYRHGLSLDAKAYDAAMGLAACYRLTGDYDRAIRSTRQAQRINPMSAEPHIVLAGVYEAQNDMRKAMRAYRMALRLAPDDSAIHNACGALNVRLTQRGGAEARIARQRACAHFRKSLQMQPNQPQIRRLLAGLEQQEDTLFWAATDDSGD